MDTLLLHSMTSMCWPSLWLASERDEQNKKEAEIRFTPSTFTLGEVLLAITTAILNNQQVYLLSECWV